MRYCVLLFFTAFNTVLYAQKQVTYADTILHVHMLLPDDSFFTRVIHINAKKLEDYYIPALYTPPADHSNAKETNEYYAHRYEFFNLLLCNKVIMPKGQIFECREQVDIQFSVGRPNMVPILENAIAHCIYADSNQVAYKYCYYVLYDSCNNEHYRQRIKAKRLNMQFIFYDRGWTFSLICSASEDRFPDCRQLFFGIANSVRFDE